MFGSELTLVIRCGGKQFVGRWDPSSSESAASLVQMILSRHGYSLPYGGWEVYWQGQLLPLHQPLSQSIRASERGGRIVLEVSVLAPDAAEGTPEAGGHAGFRGLIVEESSPPEEPAADAAADEEVVVDLGGGTVGPEEERPAEDSDSEFELSLDDSGGLAPEGRVAEGSSSKKDIFETDFEVPALDEESGSQAVRLEEPGADAESSASIWLWTKATRPPRRKPAARS